jgi:hypothetical protein
MQHSKVKIKPLLSRVCCKCITYSLTGSNAVNAYFRPRKAYIFIRAQKTFLDFNFGITYCSCIFIYKSTSKAVPVTGLGGLYGCEMLRIPHCLHSRLRWWYGCQPYEPAALYSTETLLFLRFRYSFLLEAE